MSRRTRDARKDRRHADFIGAENGSTVIPHAKSNGKAKALEPEIVETPRIEIDPRNLSSTALVAGGFLPHLRDDLHNALSESAERCSAAVERIKRLSAAQADFYEKMAEISEEEHNKEVKRFKERGL